MCVVEQQLRAMYDYLSLTCQPLAFDLMQTTYTLSVSTHTLLCSQMIWFLPVHITCCCSVLDEEPDSCRAFLGG